MVLVNGKPAETVSVHDRGLLYGDGLFETIAIENGRPRRWARHIDRLTRGCARLGIVAPLVQMLEHEARQVCADAERAVLKIIVTRGVGGRGYFGADLRDSTRIVALHPWPERPVAWAEQGVTLRTCATRLACNSRLAGLKHLNRLEQVLARNEWDDPGIAEGLMLSEDGAVIGGTMSNLFLARDGSLLTPDLSDCGVAGIMREAILERLPSYGMNCTVARVEPEDVARAAEVFVCNSIIGIWPVRRIDGVEYAVGPLTKRLLEGLASLE